MRTPWKRPRRSLGVPSRPGITVRPRPGTRVSLESLEDRTLPSVVFNSALGGETVQWQQNGKPVTQALGPGNNSTALQDPTVYFIFQGTSWTSSNAGALASDAQFIIQSPYLSKLTDYGSTGKAVFGGFTIDNTAAPDPDPDPNQQQSKFAAAAQKEIQTILPGQPSWTKPPLFNVVACPIYVVVFDKGEVDSQGNHRNAGWNGVTNYNFLSPMNEIFIGDWGGDQDGFTDTFSHEVVERIFSGSNNGLVMNASVDANTPVENQGAQISDNEPDHAAYIYRLDDNGTFLQVQAYWSLSTPNTNGLNGGSGAFVVPDGTLQNVYLDPSWTFQGIDANNNFPIYSFNGNSQLEVDGGQPGSNGNTITISTNNDLGTTNQQGGVSVTLDGEMFTFDPNQISGISVATAAGGDVVNVVSTPDFVNSSFISAGVTTSVVDFGSDTVVLGSTLSSENDGLGHVGNIKGPVFIDATGDIGEPGSASLYVDDSGDFSGQTVTMTDGTIHYGGTAIYYSPSASATDGVTYLEVDGGSGGNTFNVENTSKLNFFTFLSTGNGNDTVDVFATKGYLQVYNPGGSDSTNVGMGNTGSLNGFVYVDGPGSTSLDVMDSSDTTGRTVTMNDGSLYDLGSAGIGWSASSSPTGGVTYLEVDGGSGGNTFDINNTSTLHFNTLLSTGTGNDVVNVHATRGGLYDYNPGGQDSTNVGLDQTGGITGFVDVYGPGATSLDVNDESDTTARTVTMNDGSVTGLGGVGGTISWTPTSSATGGVTYVEVDVPAANNTINVENTSNLFDYTDLRTSFGIDTVNVSATRGSATTGGLQIFNEDSVNVDVGLGSVANINGRVTVEGFGTATVLVDDHLDNTARTATLANGSLTGLGDAAAIQSSGVVRSLTVDGPGAGSTYNIPSTPAGTMVMVNGGAGRDTFRVGSGNSLSGIQGALMVNGGGGGDGLLANDSAGATGHTYMLSNTMLWRSGIAPILYGKLATISVTAGGNDTLSLLNPVPTATTIGFNGGSGTNTLHGANVSNSWNLTGANGGRLDSVSFSNFQKLVGGTGVDVFNFNNTSATFASINGGGAPAGEGDWLNYSALPATSMVMVNLTNGSATNVGGWAVGKVTNIQNVIGSAGGTNMLIGDSQGNILIGGSGVNMLMGGSGSSLLIGGSGRGMIVGGAKSDILIAGSLSYNVTTTAAQNALMSILAELQSADTFAQKVSDIIHGNASGGGHDLNGVNKLTWGGTSPTVIGSTGAFTLAGDSATRTAADWFFANALSTVTDFNGGGVQDEHNNNAIGVF